MVERSALARRPSAGASALSPSLRASRGRDEKPLGDFVDVYDERVWAAALDSASASLRPGFTHRPGSVGAPSE